MTLFQLECFYYLSKSLNFTKTARVFFISQPALSRSILSLEKELGVDLLERNSKRVSLTPAGAIFADECKKIIGAYQYGVQKVLSLSDEIAGRIRMGAPLDSYEPIVPSLYKAVKAKYPGIIIDLKFYTPSQLNKKLDDNVVDIIISSGTPKTHNCKYLCLDKRMDCVVLANHHHLANKEEVSISDFQGENFVSLTKASSVAGYNALMKYISLTGGKIVAQADTVSSLITLVACGLGISVLYKEHSPYSAESVVFIPIKDGYQLERNLIWIQENNRCLDAVISVAKEMQNLGEKYGE